MSNTIIHPTAIVSDKAQLGENVKIGPFSIIEEGVTIGDNSEIRSNVVVSNGTTIGKDCMVCNGVVLGTEPQDLKFEGEHTEVFIGDRTVLREFVTVNRGTKKTGKTTIGTDCLIMTYSHVAHDCSVGNNVIISNAGQLAGHVTIEDWVIMGGVAKIHQFCTVGCHSMVGADVFATKDIAPYTLIGRTPPQVEGINKIGLRRRGFSKEIITDIQDFYDTLLFSGLNNRDGLTKYKVSHSNICDEVQMCIDFIEQSTRGIYR